MIYGHKWTAIAEADDGTWLQGLCGLSPRQVAHGLSKTVTRNNPWPPTLPEFRIICIDTCDDDLDEYINELAFSDIDSFTYSHLITREIEQRKNQVREKATEAFYQQQFKNAANHNMRLAHNGKD